MNLKLVKLLTVVLLNATSLLFLTACKGKETSKEASLASVNPFDTTLLEKQSLTDEDRMKLASASGKVVAPVKSDALARRILQSTDKLFVYCFWNMENQASISTVKALQKLSNNYDSSQVKVIFVNMSDVDKAEAINLFIREYQITDETLVMEKADYTFFTNQIKKTLTDITTLPVILMVNKAEETFLFYNKEMDDQELTAMMLPLM